MGQSLNEMTSYLEANGWHEYSYVLRPESRCFYKYFSTPTPCACNDSKPGLQVGVACAEIQGHVMYDLDICGELPDGSWVKVAQWGLHDGIEEGLKVIPRMLSAWEHMVAFKTEEQASC